MLNEDVSISVRSSEPSDVADFSAISNVSAEKMPEGSDGPGGVDVVLTSDLETKPLHIESMEKSEESVTACLMVFYACRCVDVYMCNFLPECWPASPDSCCTGCSPFSTPLLDLYPPSGVRSASPRFFASFTGCGFRKG